MQEVVAILRRYGWWGSLRLLIDLAYTNLAFRGARLIRRPVYIRGFSSIKLGRRFTTGVGLRLDAFPVSERVVLEIGDDVQVNDYVHIAAIESVCIGANTLIASKVFISDHHHGEYRGMDPASAPGVPPTDRPLVARPVRIGQRVWIGEHVCVMPGITIGDDAIIGAGSIVTHDIPAASIAVGNPARVIRQYDKATGSWMLINAPSKGHAVAQNEETV